MVRHSLHSLDLAAHGFENLGDLAPGVDTVMFKPHPKDFLTLPRPIAAYVGRVAVRKRTSMHS